MNQNSSWLPVASSGANPELVDHEVVVAQQGLLVARGGIGARWTRLPRAVAYGHAQPSTKAKTSG